MNGSNEDRRGFTGDFVASEKRSADITAGQIHSFLTTNRSSMVVRGVTDVLSFDETGVLLITTCGQLALEGTDLHVTVLNTKDGIVEISGRLCGLLYEDDLDPHATADKHKSKRGFFGRFLS